MSFVEGAQLCESWGATLAAVPDYDALAQAVTMDAEFIWIGLRSTPDIQGKLHWLNADGEEVTETNWRVISYDEPNGPDNGPGNDCVMINGLDSDQLFTVGDWGDYDCSFESRFLCAVGI